jgi:hypothetical protein
MSILIGDNFGQVHLYHLYNRELIKTFGNLSKNAKVTNIKKFQEQDDSATNIIYSIN